MEIKQLEYFVAASEKGSFNKAAECLYTSQPNVSKVILSLEKELGRELFVRNSKGIQLTSFGEMIKEYAQNILKNAQLIHSTVSVNPGAKLKISTFPSNLLAGILVSFYEETKENYTIEHLQGTAEEITDNVKSGLSELGVVFIAQNQLAAFQHILTHKSWSSIRWPQENCAFTWERTTHCTSAAKSAFGTSQAAVCQWSQGLFLNGTSSGDNKPWDHQPGNAQQCHLYQQRVCPDPCTQCDRSLRDGREVSYKPV